MFENIEYLFLCRQALKLNWVELADVHMTCRVKVEHEWHICLLFTKLGAVQLLKPLISSPFMRKCWCKLTGIC